MSKVSRTKQVSFRMPADVYRDYAAVAGSRGMDLSALLNWVTSEYRPKLLREKAEHDEAMRSAAVAPPTKAEKT